MDKKRKAGEQQDRQAAANSDARDFFAEAPADIPPREPAAPPVEQQDDAPEGRPVPERKLYQDEVYGTKELSPLAVALVDTPEFQRLGYVYQLGFTYAVFRGATHRRIDHSIGTYFMSRTLLRRIVQNHARFYSADPDAFRHPGSWLSPRLYVQAPGTPSQGQTLYSPMGRWRGLTELVSAAALLHDLAHVPAGHTLEDEFSVFEKHDQLGGSRLFELLYGPREPLANPAPTEAGAVPSIDRYFGPINARRLSRPAPDNLRVPLPWAFEQGTYRRFFPDIEVGSSTTRQPESLANWEVRDLIYLILSFKEEITSDEYQTFDRLLENGIREVPDDRDSARVNRLRFIQGLYDYYSRAIDLGPHHESLPLFQPFMADIVGNTISADLLDYLVRDGKRLKLDIRDNPRLQRYLVIRPESSLADPPNVSNQADSRRSPKRLTINAVYRNGLPRRDTVSDLLDLMRERYRFAEVAYYHPKKAGFSSMFAKALELTSDEHRPRQEGVYPAPWCHSEEPVPRQAHLAHLGDDAMLEYLAGPLGGQPDLEVARLVTRIRYRDEYRLLFTLDHDAAMAAGGPLKFIRDLRENRDARRRHWEQTFRHLRHMAARGGTAGAPLPVLIYCPNIRMQAKEVSARVELTPGRVIPLNREGDAFLGEEIRLLNTKYQRLWRLYLFVDPELIPLGSEESERRMLLSAMVDAFCHAYGVADDYRARGCRYRFIPFQKRLSLHFDEWQKSLPPKSPHAAIQEASQDLDLWAAVLERADAPFPVSEEEYHRGFARAAISVAAASASTRQREEWGQDLRGLGVKDWHRSAPIPRVNMQRKEALTRFDGIAASMLEAGNPKRLSADWTSFVQLVANALETH